MTLDIDEQLANFRDARALVVESLDDIDTKIAALLNAKKLLSANVKVAVTQFNGQENPSKFIPTQAHIINVKQPDVDISSIRGCASIPEAMFAWADAHGGELLGKELASAIRIAGISKAKNDNNVAANIKPQVVEMFSEMVNNAAEHGMSDTDAHCHVPLMPHRKGLALDSVITDRGPGIRATLERNTNLPRFRRRAALTATSWTSRKSSPTRSQAPQRAWAASKTGSSAMAPLPEKPAGFKNPTTTESQPPRDHSPRNCRPPSACTTSRGNGT